MKKAKY